MSLEECFQAHYKKILKSKLIKFLNIFFKNLNYKKLLIYIKNIYIYLFETIKKLKMINLYRFWEKIIH